MSVITARFGSLSLAAAAVALAGACIGDVDRIDTALSAAVESLAVAVDTAAGQVIGRDYAPGELVAVVNMYNDAEIETGAVAREKATDPEVRTFAQSLVTDHRSLKEEMSATSRRLGLAPSIPGRADGVRDLHSTHIRELQETPAGRDFDRSFIARQIEIHERALDDLEGAMDRDENAAMRGLLERTRSTMREHLSRAQELQRRLMTG